MRVWISVLVFVISMLITYSSESTAYALEPYFNLLYTLTVMNVIAGIGYLVAMIMAVFFAVKLKSASSYLILIVVLSLSIVWSWINFFITAMWWG